MTAETGNDTTDAVVEHTTAMPSPIGVTDAPLPPVDDVVARRRRDVPLLVVLFIVFVVLTLAGVVTSAVIGVSYLGIGVNTGGALAAIAFLVLRKSRFAEASVPWVILGALGVVAVLGAGVALAGNNSANRAHAEALAEWREARLSLAAELQGAEAVALEAGEAGTDPEAVEALQTVIVSARGLHLDINPALTRAEDVARARDVVDVAHDARLLVADASLNVRAATTVRLVDQALVDLEAAHAEVTAALQGARERLAVSEGHVLDDAPRIALSETIDAAALTGDAADVAGLRAAVIEATADLSDRDTAVRQRVADGEITVADDVVVTADSVAERAAALREHVPALAAAQQAVTDAEGAWHAEQERIAAEQAASAAAAQQQRSTSTSGGSSSRTGSSSTGKGTSGGAKAPAAKGGSSTGSPSSSVSTSGSGSGSTSGSGGGSSSGGGTWVESGPGGTWCGTGDTSGAEASGGWC